MYVIIYNDRYINLNTKVKLSVRLASRYIKTIKEKRQND